MTIRRCRDDEHDDILSIINAAAEAYRGVIRADRWHEPYMPGDAFDRERTAGVVFWGYEDRGRLAGANAPICAVAYSYLCRIRLTLIMS